MHNVSDLHSKTLAPLYENWPHSSRARQQGRLLKAQVKGGDVAGDTLKAGTNLA